MEEEAGVFKWYRIGIRSGGQPVPMTTIQPLSNRATSIKGSIVKAL